MKAMGMLVYTAVLALWVGGITMFTFVVTPVIFRSYGRDQAGDIVGRLMPVYFRYNLVLVLAALALVFLFWWAWSPTPRRLTLVLLLAAALCQGYVTLRLYPQIVSVKKAVVSFEANSESFARQRFRSLHGLSMALNLAVLADGALLLVLRPLLGG